MSLLLSPRKADWSAPPPPTPATLNQTLWGGGPGCWSFRTPVLEEGPPATEAAALLGLCCLRNGPGMLEGLQHLCSLSLVSLQAAGSPGPPTQLQIFHH